jgi:hypothetical protein
MYMLRGAKACKISFICLVVKDIRPYTQDHFFRAFFWIFLPRCILPLFVACGTMVISRLTSWAVVQFAYLMHRYVWIYGKLMNRDMMLIFVPGLASSDVVVVHTSSVIQSILPP